MFMTADRLPYVEYLAVTLPTRLAFVFRDPPLTYVSNIYYLPFTGIVWICAMALVVVSTAVIYCTFRLSKETKAELTTSDFVLYAISTVCQMGSILDPKRLSGKFAMVEIVKLVIWLFN